MFEQQRQFDQLIRRTDLLVARPASRTAEDAAFEQRYADYLEAKHGRLTVHGIDLHHGGDRPLGTACPGLAGTHRGEHASPSASGLPAALRRRPRPAARRPCPGRARPGPAARGHRFREDHARPVALRSPPPVRNGRPVRSPL
ncbi:hypothetical protein GCM10010238_64400 [Streptomyces griseoviridis]|uniref:Uncharacterized protein n=1 Tax=Streptomyces griseoviridis TaxID=45398 RepID=A0A918LKB7_STRGD|nr:hypothetical protein GCM10010238_64400 [Streptomyces niveoruber]